MTQTILMTPERVVFNAGQFDSDRRYLRETSGTHLTTLLAGPSIAFAARSQDTFTYNVGWRFKVGAYEVTGEDDSGDYPPPSSITNTPTNIVL
ncbi:hypothetical protein [Hyphomicrobium sp. CS1GBMeth3]|uniref:hypothetical protein n=1 Tax=Hyphomicrobium sp. CS1GBMeth3 TaxID=1892845 RepID=UPI0009314843|nr:hypothetical protein [Hyphomicrobium sp. CS1GBMeth3]